MPNSLDTTINNLVSDTLLNESTYGAVLACFGNVAINIGMNLIKIGQSTEDSERESERRRKASPGKPSPATLLLGWVLFILGNGINFTALSMAPQTLLASLGGLQFIANLIFLGCYLGEPVTVRNLCGTFLVILGNTIILYGYNPKKSGAYTIAELYSFFISREYKIYTGVSLSCFVLFQMVTNHMVIKWWWGRVPIPRFHIYKPVEKHPLYTLLKAAPLTQPGARSYSVSVSPSTSPDIVQRPRSRYGYINDLWNGVEEVRNESTPEVEYKPQRPPALKKSSLFGLIYSMCSAAIGVQALLTGKSLSIIVRNITQGSMDILDPRNFFNLSFAFVVFILWIFATAFWIWRLSVSLIMFDAMFIIPVNQTMWILFSVLSGGIVWNEFANLNFVESSWLASGLSLVLIGVVFLMPIEKVKPGDFETDEEASSKR